MTSPNKSTKKAEPIPIPKEAFVELANKVREYEEPTNFNKQKLIQFFQRTIDPKDPDRQYIGYMADWVIGLLKELAEEALPSKRIEQDDEDIKDEFSGKALAHELQENNINIGHNQAIDQTKANIRKLIGEDK